MIVGFMEGANGIEAGRLAPAERQTRVIEQAERSIGRPGRGPDRLRRLRLERGGMDQGLLRGPLPAGSLDPVWTSASQADRPHPLGRHGDGRAFGWGTSTVRSSRASGPQSRCSMTVPSQPGSTPSGREEDACHCHRGTELPEPRRALSRIPCAPRSSLASSRAGDHQDDAPPDVSGRVASRRLSCCNERPCSEGLSRADDGTRGREIRLGLRRLLGFVAPPGVRSRWCRAPTGPGRESLWT